MSLETEAGAHNKTLTAGVKRLTATSGGFDYSYATQTTIKVLKNTASKKVEEELSTFKEYTEKYSHLTYEEYLKTKSKKK